MEGEGRVRDLKEFLKQASKIPPSPLVMLHELGARSCGSLIFAFLPVFSVFDLSGSSALVVMYLI